jgi:hypothetical protein
MDDGFVEINYQFKNNQLSAREKLFFAKNASIIVLSSTLPNPTTLCGHEEEKKAFKLTFIMLGKYSRSL